MKFSKTSLCVITQKTYVFVALALGSLGIMSGSSLPAYAQTMPYDQLPYSNPICGCDPYGDGFTIGGCCIAAGTIMGEVLTGGINWTKDNLQQDFYIDDLYDSKIKPYLEQMSSTWRNAAIMAGVSDAMFIDGHNLMSATLSIQKSNVQTQKDFMPSDQVCRFGTLSRSMANSQQKAEVAKIAISTNAINRQLLRANMASSVPSKAGTTIGDSPDKVARWAQFTTMFCDKDDVQRTDSTSATNPFCTNTSDEQVNRDIDMTRTLDVPNTLDLDYSTAPGANTKDSQNIMALSSNLYGSTIISNLGGGDFRAIARADSDSKKTQKSLSAFFDYRSAVAKRSVALNSFATIAGMKAAGDGSVKPYIVEAMKELGLQDGTGSTPNEIKLLLGDKPSYDAQMKVLTKLIYQDPAFYANLMESPQNVARQQSAMEGIALAQDRDIYESLRRSEMLLSTLLEIQVEREQDKYKDKEMN